MALQLTPEDIAKLQDKQLANVIRKLNAGKTLTAKEEALLAKAKAGGEPVAASGYANTWEDLADALTVDRRTLTNFRNRYKAEIKQRGRTLIRADGRKPIAAWAALLDECGCRPRGVNAEIAGGAFSEQLEADGLPSERNLKRRELKLRLDRQEFELAKAKERMLEVGHFEHALGAMLSQFRQSLDALPSRCAGMLGDLDVRNIARELIREVVPKIRNAKTEDDAMQIAELHVIRLLPEPDYHFRLSTILKEVEITKRTLRECRYLEAAAPTLTDAAAAEQELQDQVAEGDASDAEEE